MYMLLAEGLVFFVVSVHVMCNPLAFDGIYMFSRYSRGGGWVFGDPDSALPSGRVPVAYTRYCDTANWYEEDGGSLFAEGR